jgi:amino acid transporter
MLRYANFTVAFAAAVAVVIVVPVIWHGALLAWVVSGVLFVALLVALVMYFVGRRKPREPLAGTNIRPSGPSAVIGNVIGAYGHSKVKRNYVDTNINIYNAPPVQPVPPNHAEEPAQPVPPNDAEEPDDH